MDPVSKTALREKYKKIRNEITSDKRISKTTYYTAYFERNKNKSYEVWKGIRTLVNLKTTKSSNIKLMDENSNLITDQKKNCKYI